MSRCFSQKLKSNWQRGKFRTLYTGWQTVTSHFKSTFLDLNSFNQKIFYLEKKLRLLHCHQLEQCWLKAQKNIRLYWSRCSNCHHLGQKHVVKQQSKRMSLQTSNLCLTQSQCRLWQETNQLWVLAIVMSPMMSQTSLRWKMSTQRIKKAIKGNLVSILQQKVRIKIAQLKRMENLRSGYKTWLLYKRVRNNQTSTLSLSNSG